MRSPSARPPVLDMALGVGEPALRGLPRDGLVLVEVE